MEKRGTGTLAMNGDNTYTGATTIANGTLVLNGNTQSIHTVKNGAVLILGDKYPTFKTKSINLKNGAVLDLRNASANIQGDLNANGATIYVSSNTATVSGTANLRNAKILLVKDGKTVPVENIAAFVHAKSINR